MSKNIRRIQKRSHAEQEITVQEAVETYLHSPHVKKLELGTQKEYKDELEVFAVWCATHAVVQDGHKRGKIAIELGATSELSPVMLHQVNDQSVHLFMDHLNATHQPRKKTSSDLATSTLAGYVRVIKSFLNWCFRDDQYKHHVSSDTIARIEKPHVVEVVTETFTSDQINALFSACDKEESEHLQMRDRAILAMLFDTGVRAHELTCLTIGHTFLDAKDPHIRILGKRDKWREVGMGDQARREIQKYIKTFREPTIEYAIKKQHPNSSDYQIKQLVKAELQTSLLYVSRTGTQLQVGGLRQLIDRLGEWAHIDGVQCSPHICRHTYSMMFIRNGGSIYRLSKLLGHSSVMTTERYLKSIQQSEARRGAKSLLDNLQ